jgi:hypothetical protein
VDGDDRAAAESDHHASLHSALAAADADARWGDYRAALRWLAAAEQLNVVLPTEHAEKRRRWMRKLDEETEAT